MRAWELNEDIENDLQQLAKQIMAELKLQSFDVYMVRGDIKLGSIIVGKENRKEGIGSTAIKKLTQFADEHNKRIILSPAVKDTYHGTTSRSRLLNFYKQFGFYENKGRHKDFSISSSMVRDPKENITEIKKSSKTFTCRWCKKDFKSEFGQFCPHCHRFQDSTTTINVGRKINENSLEQTKEYNEAIIDFLTDFEIDAKEYMDTILVSRDSMMNAIRKNEDTSYHEILNLIREYMPKNLYIIWSGKDDDYYYLEIFKKDEKAQLNELKEYLDSNEYGAWINVNGEVENVSSHEEWMDDNYGFNYHNEDRYPMAFGDGWVRFINNRRHFSIQGNPDDIRIIFKYWWPSAIQSEMVYIEDEKWDLLGRYRMPDDKMELREKFGPDNKQINENKEKLPDDVIDAFTKLGDKQRGAPEHAMLKIQHLMGGGVLNPAVEHIGDLTHRMSHMAKYGSFGYDMFADKVIKTLKWLTNPYGFEKEFKENIKNNAKHRNINPEELKEKLDKALENYANEHSKLPVYNKLQWVSRQAAIDLGRQNFSSTISHLEYLQYIIKDVDRYNSEASKVYQNNNGDLIQYKPGMSESIINEDNPLDREQITGLWINPDGKIIDTDDWAISHATTFIDYIKDNDLNTYKKLNIYTDEKFGRHPTNADEFMVINFALKNGWIRILEIQPKPGTNVTPELNIDFNKEYASNKAKIVLKRLISKANVDRYVINDKIVDNNRQAIRLISEKVRN